MATTLSHVAFSAAPTVGPSNLIFSNVGNSQMTLNWTNGDGAARIVVLRTGSPVTADPVDGLDYVNYQSLVGGQIVVYKGSGSTFDFKNTGFGPLVPGTDYHFEIFEFNGSGMSTEFLTSSTAVGNQIAASPIGEPTSGASNFTFPLVEGNSIDLSWSSGDGANRIVVAKEGSAVDAAPIDGSGYVLYQSLGGGNVIVYNGNGNSVTVNSLGFGVLPVNTTYHFAIFEYNGSNFQANYNTTLPLTGSQATLPLVNEPTTQISSPTLGFRTDQPEQRIDISWTGGDGSGTMVIMRAGTPPDAGVNPQDGIDYPQWGTLAADHWICYKGPANQFELKSNGIGDLDPSTTYYFRFIEFNGSGGTVNYLTTAVPTFNATSLGATPSNPPSNLQFVPSIGTSQTVSWTNGGGSGRLVIAKQGSPVNFVPFDLPMDGTTYAINQNLGSGNFVVYNGSGNTFLFDKLNFVTLARNTTYHLAVIEYSGSGTTTNYLTENGGDVLTGSVLTPNFAAEPTTAPSNLIFSNVSNSSMTLTWTNGNGARRIVLARRNTPVGSVPTDGISYSLFQTVGGAGTVVYDGTGNSFVFNNDGTGPLTAGATYHFRVFEYNGTGTITNYLTSSFLSGSQIASSGTPEPTIASTNLVFSNVQTNKMTLTWTNGNGANRIVVFRVGSAVTAVPTDGVSYSQFQNLSAGQSVAYVGSSNTFLFDNTGTGPLSPGTTYHFAIYEFNGSGALTNYLSTPNLIGNQVTSSLATEPTVATSNLLFSNVLTDEMTLNWTNGNGANRLIIFRQGAAVTVTPTDGVSYSQYQSLASGQVVIYNGTGTSYRFANTGLGPLLSGTTYHFAIFEFNGSGQLINYLQSPNLTGNQATQSIQSEPTVAASSLFFTSVLDDEMTLNWTSGNGANRIVIAREGSAVTAVPSDGVTYSQYQSISAGQIVIYNGNGSSYRFRNTGSGPLSSGTTYHYAIYEYNGAAGGINYLTSSFLFGSQSTTGGGGGGRVRTLAESEENFTLDIESKSEQLTVYPNPATNFVTLSLDPDEFNEIAIISMDSKLIYSKNDIIGNHLQIDVNEFRPGLYLVYFKGKNGVVSKKLLVR